MPPNQPDEEWDRRFRGFLKHASDEFKRAAADVKHEAERLMKEAQDPHRQAQMRQSVHDASVWARKTAEQLASLVESGVKQAEEALGGVAKHFSSAPPQSPDFDDAHSASTSSASTSATSTPSVPLDSSATASGPHSSGFVGAAAAPRRTVTQANTPSPAGSPAAKRPLGPRLGAKTPKAPGRASKKSIGRRSPTR